MSGSVWISRVRSDSRIGNKQGPRAKFYGQDWEPARFEIPVASERVLAALRHHRQGVPLERTEMTEAVAVWEETRFKRVGDLFYAGPFMAVKGKLAEVLSRFNLGAGGLVPLPVYKADLETPVNGEFFLLNFGGPKDSFLPEQSNSEAIRKLYFDKAIQRQIWRVESLVKDDGLALSPAALEGADLWSEQTVFNDIFMSDDLVAALRAAKIKIDFRLSASRIERGGQ